MTDWHSKEVAEALNRLDADQAGGLSSESVLDRLKRFGPNELVDGGKRGPWRILWRQFTSTLVLILVVAAVLSGILGQSKEAIAIGAIVLLFGLLGFVQEHRAETAMSALKRLAVPTVRVYRDGTLREVSARELVPGDLLVLEAGNLVPADCRVVESVNLRIQEAALTGESEPVDKKAHALPRGDAPVAERFNMAYLGTLVVFGRGRALVVETGMRTELGAIATMLQSPDVGTTPLQRRLDNVGKVLAAAGLAVAAIVFALGFARGDDVRHLLLTAVSIAVAVVPEGLPAVVTITLALGARRMLRRNALIRKLPAVETLGSVTVICSDKTGTLTKNQMVVTVLEVAGRRIALASGSKAGGASAAGDSGTAQSAVATLLAGSALCNDATLKANPPAAGLEAIGDPTEGALLVAASEAGLRKEALERLLPRVAELPFDSERKRMTTVHRMPHNIDGVLGEALARVLRGPEDRRLPPYVAFTKGAPDVLLALCSRVWGELCSEPLTPRGRGLISASAEQMAGKGMRVLGVALRGLEAVPAAADGDVVAEVEQDLVFVGLVGMIDPPRPEVALAVRTCRAAGIRPVMITGDHRLTALQIARELGIADGGRLLTGHELQTMSISELESLVDEVSVYARVSPEHKLKIIEALQRKGHIVAMTGDGVNDAPALRKADIGVAMGITGTDVAKEAADMVLRDDNFASIVAAIEEGRTIYDNLRKFIKFSIAGNIGKVSVMLLSPFLGGPLPLLPLQLLWLNLLTDGLLGLGLGLEPVERNAMRRPPQAPNEGVFARGMGRHILWVGLMIGAIGLGVGYWQWARGYESWQTMLFTTLAFAQVAQAFGVRSGRESLRTLGVLSNKPLAALATLVFALQLAVVYVPFLQEYFRTVALSWTDLVTSVAMAGVVLIAIEAEKWTLRRCERREGSGRAVERARAKNGVPSCLSEERSTDVDDSRDGPTLRERRDEVDLEARNV